MGRAVIKLRLPVIHGALLVVPRLHTHPVRKSSANIAGQETDFGFEIITDNQSRKSVKDGPGLVLCVQTDITEGRRNVSDILLFFFTSTK